MQKACIIIPCYNEALRLDLNAFDKFINAEHSIDFLFVNDGSTDNTLELLQKFKNQNNARVSILNMPINSGKAEAVRCGVLEICKNKNYEFAGFWDADLATPLSEITNFLYQVKNKPTNIAIGSRMKRLGAVVERKRSRHLLGRVFSTFASLILKMPVYDTQCGAKIFKCDLFVLFEEKFITSWLFDIELLARYRNKFGIQCALNEIIEVPINAWIEKGGSKLKLKHILKVPFELMVIYKKYN
jgi:glycosyltransferase involved in cell wall biosynthesis